MCFGERRALAGTSPAQSGTKRARKEIERLKEYKEQVERLLKEQRDRGVNRVRPPGSG